jgi:hypothetical protein
MCEYSGSYEQQEAYTAEVCEGAFDGYDYTVSNAEGEIIAQGEA